MRDSAFQIDDDTEASGLPVEKEKEAVTMEKGLAKEDIAVGRKSSWPGLRELTARYVVL
jgi:hypothetical protein